MKRFSFIRLLFVVAFMVEMVDATPVRGQRLEKEVQTSKYLRNSVCLMMMEDESIPQKYILEDSFLNAEWNAKYNNHNIDCRVIDPSQLEITSEDVESFNLACTSNEQYLDLRRTGMRAPKQTIYNEAMTQILRNAMAEMTETVDTVIQLNAARKANKYLIENQVAKQCFDKWFMDAEGNYSEAVLAQRGLMNASAAEQEVAAASVAARQKLLREKMDVDELVGNTFVVVSRFSYKDKDGVVNDRLLPLEAAAQLDPSGYGGMAISLAKMAIKASVGAGYYVTVDSYLFRLRWTPEIREQFFALWNEKGEFDKEAYEKAQFASLQFIGNERAWARTRAGLFTEKSEEELIRLAAVDAVDEVLAKFERKYDQFKTKTPLYISVTKDKKGREKRNYGVLLGKRDGLKGGEKFEVLEKVEKKQDDGTVKITYNKKGELEVDKKHVWDNTYSTLLAKPSADGHRPYTALKGKGKTSYYDGMLLRLKSGK